MPMPPERSRHTTTKHRSTKVSTDFLPIKAYDHVEFYVGNAKQAAHFYDKTF